MKILNGKNMTTRSSAHDEIARVLEFPEHYGRNLDALWDLLTEEKRQIMLTNSAEMLGALGDYGTKLIETFREADTVEFIEE